MPGPYHIASSVMSDYLIDEGMEVTLHFTLKLEDGKQ